MSLITGISVAVSTPAVARGPAPRLLHEGAAEEPRALPGKVIAASPEEAFTSAGATLRRLSTHSASARSALWLYDVTKSGASSRAGQRVDLQI